MAPNTKKLDMGTMSPKQLQEFIAQQQESIVQAQQKLAENQAERMTALRAKLEEMCIEEGFTGLHQVFFNKTGKTGKLEPKYKHPTNGKTWTGRGIQPKWMEGDKEKYLISKAA